MSLGQEIRSERQARAILKLAADAHPSTWRAAFQREVKAAHPDRGGDTEQVRLVIEAYRFLKLVETGPRPAPPGPAPRPAAARPRRAAPRPTAPEPEAQPQPQPQVEPSAPPKTIAVSIMEAFIGCERTVGLPGGKACRLVIPGGLRAGDVVRFGQGGEHRATIEIAPMPDAELKGADLWLTVAVSAEFQREGGRMEVDTPLGRRQFWVSRTSAARGLFRAPGEGLPARGARAKGHLYLRFELDEGLGESPARSLLDRFASIWGGR